jgi:glycosyltransferase involved in cell wall biosynthesis
MSNQTTDSMPPVSVVLCARNEASRIRKSLLAIAAANPAEIVVIDGNSEDETAAIAREFTDQVIVSKAGSLTADRQVGIDATSHDLIAMIDADHRILPDTLQGMYADLCEFDFDVVQSNLGIEDTGFWTAAENQAFDVFLNHPGPKTMIGTAPAMYRRRVFEVNRFDAHITEHKDDADFFYRLSQVEGYSFGSGRTRVMQEHFASFSDYVKKFAWYGIGDSEFCVKHPERAPSMFFHLFFRYPVLRSLSAIAKGNFKAVPYLIVCGWVRGGSMVRNLWIRKTKPANTD